MAHAIRPGSQCCAPYCSMCHSQVASSGIGGTTSGRTGRCRIGSTPSPAPTRSVFGTGCRTAASGGGDGGAVYVTATGMFPDAKRPTLSNPEHVTVVVPTGNELPLAGMHDGPV